MRKKIGFIWILLLVGGCGQMESVQEHVEKHYSTAEGLIHAYPEDQDSDYLSESVGLYLDYLLLAEDQQTFHEQYQLLKEHFVETEDDAFFVRWRLNEESSTNALIDDIRIASALERGAELFGNKKYAELAATLNKTISAVQQHEGYTVDFYDWSLSLPAERLTLSYLNKSNAISEKSIGLLKNTDDSQMFFPEYYDTAQKKYMNNEEVHLIDQLLIALNREKTGQHSELFLSWIKEEWTSEHKLFGRYDRETRESTVDYESLAVYYYLHAYLSLMEEETMADEVVQRAKDIATEDTLNQAHFFDYIHYELMLKEQ